MRMPYRVRAKLWMSVGMGIYLGTFGAILWCINT